MDVRARRPDSPLVVELVHRDGRLLAGGVDEVAVEVCALLRLQPARAGHALEPHLTRARDLPSEVLGLLLVDLDLARAAARARRRERKNETCRGRPSHRDGIVARRRSGRPGHGYDESFRCSRSTAATARALSTRWSARST